MGWFINHTFQERIHLPHLPMASLNKTNRPRCPRLVQWIPSTRTICLQNNHFLFLVIKHLSGWWFQPI